MSSSKAKAARPMPDLVRLSKLDHSFSPDSRSTLHIYPVPGDRYAKERELWKRRKELGRGSYGAVYLEECRRGQQERGTMRAANDGSLRAVKVIRKPKHSEYYRELEALSFFSYPQYERCFVKSFGWYEDTNRIYVAMEYLPLGDLEQYLNKLGSLPPGESRLLVYQLAEGLAFMHDNGFVHRDLKPANVLVKAAGPSWWIKIADFGLSKRITEEFTALRTTTGTPVFMAPEVLGFNLSSTSETDDSYTDAVDMWSLGIISFLLLTGEVCFRDQRHLGRYVHGIEGFPVDALSEVGGNSACEFVQSLIAVDPQMRPSAEMTLQHAWLVEDRINRELQQVEGLSITSIEQDASVNGATPLSSWKASAVWTIETGPASSLLPQRTSISQEERSVGEEVKVGTECLKTPSANPQSIGSVAQALPPSQDQQNVGGKPMSLSERPMKHDDSVLASSFSQVRGEHERAIDREVVEGQQFGIVSISREASGRTTSEESGFKPGMAQVTEKDTEVVEEITDTMANKALVGREGQEKAHTVKPGEETPEDEFKRRFESTETTTLVRGLISTQIPTLPELPTWLIGGDQEQEGASPGVFTTSGGLSVKTSKELQTAKLTRLNEDNIPPYQPPSATSHEEDRSTRNTTPELWNSAPPSVVDPTALLPSNSSSSDTISKPADSSAVSIEASSDSYSWTMLGKEAPFAVSVDCVAFSPDSKSFAAARKDGAAITFYTLAHSNTFGGPGVVETGSRLATGKLSSFAAKGAIKEMKYSSDSKLLVALFVDIKSAEVRAWNFETGKEELSGPRAQFDRTLGPGIFSSTSPTVASLSPGCHSVMFGGAGGLLYLCRLEHSKPLWKVQPIRQEVTCVAFSPDGQMVAAGYRTGEIQLLEPKNGTQVQSLVGHRHKIWSVQFSQDGRYVISVSGPVSTDGEVAVWGVAKGEQLGVFPGRKAALSPDMTTVAVCTDGAARPAIRLFGVKTGKKVAKLSSWSGWVQDMAFSPNGRMLITGQSNGSVKIWEGSDAELAIQPEKDPSGTKNGTIGTRLGSLFPAWKWGSKTTRYTDETIEQKEQRSLESTRRLLGISGRASGDAVVRFATTPLE